MARSNEVFTPSTPAKLTFVERDSVNTQIVNALNTSGMQLVIYGHSGCGKTTLIVNKLRQIYEMHITVRCISTTIFEEIVLQAFDELNPFYISERACSHSNSRSIKLKADYQVIQAEISRGKELSQAEKSIRLLPPTLTVQTLARFLGNAGCCLVLEDFHKIHPEEKTKISQSMKLFMDMAEEYPELKIICIGAVETGREVIQYDPEMCHRVAEIMVPLMTDDEIREIPVIGFPMLNIVVPTFLIDRIVKMSNGVPSVAHAICLHICFVVNRLQRESETINVSEENFKQAMSEYIMESADTIGADFEKAIKQKKGIYRNANIIFKSLADFEVSGAEYHDILVKIQLEYANYPPGNLSAFLKDLQRGCKGSCIVKRANNFCFKTPLYHTYAQYLFGKTHEEVITTDSINYDLQVIKEKINYLQQRMNHPT